MDLHDIDVGVAGVDGQCGATLEAGDDADAVGWFALDDLPELAFETDRAFLSELAGADG